MGWIEYTARKLLKSGVSDGDLVVLDNLLFKSFEPDHSYQRRDVVSLDGSLQVTALGFSGRYQGRVEAIRDTLFTDLDQLVASIGIGRDTFRVDPAPFSTFAAPGPDIYVLTIVGTPRHVGRPAGYRDLTFGGQV